MISLHGMLKIEDRCGAVYGRPKILFYSHINSSESIRLMSAESTTRHTIDKVEVFEVIIQVF